MIVRMCVLHVDVYLYSRKSDATILWLAIIDSIHSYATQTNVQSCNIRAENIASLTLTSSIASSCFLVQTDSKT